MTTDTTTTGVRRRRRPIAVLAAAVLAALCAAGVLALRPGDTDEARIARVVVDFGAATETGDRAAMAPLLCDADADALDDADAVDTSVAPGGDPRPWGIADVRVVGDSAQARVSIAGVPPTEVTLTRDADGQWRVCPSDGQPDGQEDDG